ncbi:hypothetical protein BASA83_003780 [Batrachochytrium salamandrivorans]|nr:hypothetical protein BASA83_003780 [Batrachochytrium salamandrivorans]
MYSPNPVLHNVVEVDKLYVQKLKDSIDEMSAIKQNSIMNEDYTTADQMRLKITALQVQLMKMEDQFSADVLNQRPHTWQTELATSIQSSLVNPTLYQRFIGVSILQAEFHVDFLNIVKSIPSNYCDAIIRAVLVINPQELPDTPKSPYGWEFMSKKMAALSTKPADTVDAVKATVTLVIADVISIILGLTTSTDVRRETHDLILRHAFNYFHYMSLRRMNLDTEGRIFEKIFIRLSVAIGDVAHTANSRRDIYKFVLGYLDSQRKITAEETIMSLSSIRYVSAPVKSEDEVTALTYLMRELVIFHDKIRKTSLKIAAIQALERLIQPLGFGTKQMINDANIWNEIAEIYKKARKWSTFDDEKPAALHLMVIILVNARFEFFAQNIDSFLNADLCPKAKVKPYSFECILQLLRGRYYVDTREHWRGRANGTFQFGKSYGSLTRAPEDQSSGGVANRLNIICELLFFRRKGPIPDDYLDVCVDIVVQITAHNLHIGLKLISELMNTNSVDSGPDVFYIGVCALRTIVNPESGFSTYAFCKSEDNFENILQEFPFELELNFTHILNYIDVQVGVGVMGTSGQVLDPLVNPADIKSSSLPTRHFSSEVRSRDDILSMLRSAVDITSSQLSASPDEHAPLSPTLSLGNLNLRQLPGSPLNRSATSRLMREAALSGATSGSSVDSISGSDGLQHKDSQFSLLDTYRDSYRRDSQLGLSPLAPSTLFQDISSKELDEKVHMTIKEWFDVCHADGKTPAKYHITASLTDHALIRKRDNMKLRSEQRLALRLLKEVIRTTPFIPTPELIGGNLFIGAYLNHASDEIGAEVVLAMRTIFERYPPLRIGILNGFINFIKNTVYQDDISICTVMTFLAQLTKIWVTDFEEAGPIDQRSFLRVSCKVDAAILVMLCRSTSRIRKPCLQILLDIYTIQQTFDTHQQTIHEMPLAAILVQMEPSICKQGVYAFLEKSLIGHLLSPRVSTSLRSLTFLEVASCDYTVLFRFYLGELALRFATYGRSKAIRHCAKFLRIIAIPLITSISGINTPSIEDGARFSALMALTMALSGVPLISEIEYSPHKSRATSDDTLFDFIKPLIPLIVASETFVEVKPILDNVYYLHRSITQLFIAEILNIGTEIRHNSAKMMNKRVFDNIMYALRRLSQNPSLDAIIESSIDFEPVAQLSLIDMFSELITLACVPLSDVNFLSGGPTWRLKTAVNFCVAVQRFSESLVAVKRTLQRRVIVTQDFSDLERFDNHIWPSNHRHLAITRMREWYEIVLEITPSMQITNETRKAVSLRRKLLRKVGIAAEKIMLLGNIFLEDIIPSDILTWLTTLETNGYRVFTPDLLYSSDEALGTVLANSYSTIGVHSQVFFEAIFEQILPQLDENPRIHIFGDNRRMSYAEDYFASMHSLPMKSQEDDSSALIYPNINRINALRLRQHFGSLLFFGLFNLLNVSKVVRSRSLVFVRELITMFCPDDSFSVQSYFSGLTGGFYSGSDSFLRPKILEMSNTTSSLFAADSGSFLWEAVRCFRSAQNQTVSTTLVPVQRWVLELIVPWCRFADFTSLLGDVVKAEFFRFMMDVAFKADSEYHDYMHTCWSEIARSPQNGAANADVMIDFVIQVSARFDQFRSQSLALMSTLFKVHPDNVAAILAYHLKSLAFPWRADGGSSRRAMAPHLKDYIASLEVSLSYRNVRDQSVNDYTLLCRYISPSTILAVGLVEGFVSWSHETDSISLPNFDAALANIRKLMGLFEARDCEVMWEFLPPSESILTPLSSAIRAKDWIDLILGVFVVVCPNIRTEIIEEVLYWVNEGFLNSFVTSRAVDVYHILITSTDVADDLIDPLTGRILDHLSILAQLEGDVLTHHSKSPSSDAKASKTGWDSLSKGKLGIMNGTAKVIYGIMQVHGALLRRNHGKGQLIQSGEFFWPSIGLLYLPAAEFSELYLAVVDNLIFFIKNGGEGLHSDEFLAPFNSHLSDRFLGIQLMLLQAIFCENDSVQTRSFELLLLCWIKLPIRIVDPNKTGSLFMILYTSLWIFSHMCSPITDSGDIDKIVRLFKEALTKRHPENFEDVHICLQSILDAIRKEELITESYRDELFERTMTDFISAFIPEYINNIAEFLAQAIMIEGVYGALSLSMATILWRMTGLQGFHNIGSLRNFVRRIPFLGAAMPKPIILYQTVFQDKFEGMPVKNLDLVSQGRTESFVDREHPNGSARSASLWFSIDLGVQPSNNVYSALLQ